MDAMDARRLRLYELLKDKLGEEGARELVLNIGPRPEDIVTKADLADTARSTNERIDATNERIESTSRSLNERVDSSKEELIHRMDAGFARLETVVTRRMIAIMGGWTVTLASAAAWASQVFG